MTIDPKHRDAAARELDVERLRSRFPGLHQEIHGRPLVYLDNAATTQKPDSVLEAVAHAYTFDCANVHRAVHELGQRATQAFESARTTLQRFLNAGASEEIVFLRGATEAMNLVAQSWARPRLVPGDRILVSEMEHHSNIVPWQLVAQATGAELSVLPMTDAGELALEELDECLGERTRILAVAHVSNALGTIHPLAELIERAHAAGAVVAVDGAQAAPHLPIDVRGLGADFYALSGHKMYGPTGIGVLYGRRELLEEMPPYQGGGDMIRSVSFEETSYNDLPYRFEAGTPHVAGAIGLAAAADFLNELGWEAIAAHEGRLLRAATEALRAVPGLRFLGGARERVAVLAFVLEGLDPHDVGTGLDQEGIAVRTGHHCAQPTMKHFELNATVRASFGVYNTEAEVERLARGLISVRAMFGL